VQFSSFTKCNFVVIKHTAQTQLIAFQFQDPKIVSDRNLAVLVRQVALHCNLAAQIQRSVSVGREPYASNWLERLRAIKRIREKVIKEHLDNNDSQETPAPNDFTVAVLRRKEPTD
jgi:hypothetical protein